MRKQMRRHPEWDKLRRCLLCWSTQRRHGDGPAAAPTEKKKKSRCRPIVQHHLSLSRLERKIKKKNLSTKISISRSFCNVIRTWPSSDPLAQHRAAAISIRQLLFYDSRSLSLGGSYSSSSSLSTLTKFPSEISPPLLQLQFGYPIDLCSILYRLISVYTSSEMMEKHWRFIDLLNNGAPTLWIHVLFI